MILQFHLSYLKVRPVERKDKMIYLTSNGITSKELLSHFKKNCRGGIAAIITTASVALKEKDKNIPSVIEVMKTCGYKCEFYDIEFDEPKKLLDFDLIYIIGGNPFYLLNQIKIKKFESVFCELYNKDTPIVGVSAGSMVFTNNINIVNLLDDRLNKNIGLDNFNALGLVDFEICPHYEMFRKQFDLFDEILETYIKETNPVFYKINDGGAICVNQEEISIIDAIS